MLHSSIFIQSYLSLILNKSKNKQYLEAPAADVQFLCDLSVSALKIQKVYFLSKIEKVSNPRFLVRVGVVDHYRFAIRQQVVGPFLAFLPASKGITVDNLNREHFSFCTFISEHF